MLALSFLISALIQTASATAQAPPVPATQGSASLPEQRRLITAEGGDGKTVIIGDGPSPNARVLNGSKITRLWETSQMPAPLGVTRDEGAAAGNAYREGFAGTSLYVADLPAGIKIDMHKQDSLDYIAVLTGEVDVVLDKGPVRLHQGDVLIQAGNLHGWSNPTTKPSRIMVVVLTGKRGPLS